ncbi:hypothetical protein [Longimicrobium terrae]|uniref:Uncharacterized protein n=1 Tax=Longimicrobium terrae TaxID=1639882 RepID=A0A841H6T7_9BACT|nr:hypothetical protein [Longimicrobium terrae]MBB4638178.1 hypothetical protein [Longimicrobium terrae]MBB6073663.1 hypothetical protein [Longimicrobium terrae]
MNDRVMPMPGNGDSVWAGMGDYTLIGPDGRHEVSLRYAGEPPHGDSCHELRADGVLLPGLAWGCNFAFTPDGRYFAASWIAERYERRTIIIDLDERRYLVLPIYIYDFRFVWPTLAGAGDHQQLRYDFHGRERWTPYS